MVIMDTLTSPIETRREVGWFKRGACAVALGGAAALTTLPWVAEGATVDGPIGPLDTTTTLTRDNTLTVDLGLLGGTTTALDLPFGIGARVEVAPVEEMTIATLQEAIGPALAGNLSESDLMFLLGNPIGDAKQIGHRMLQEVAKGELRVAVGVAAAILALESLMGASRRKELMGIIHEKFELQRDDVRLLYPVFNTLSPSLAAYVSLLSASVVLAPVVTDGADTLTSNLNPGRLIARTEVHGLVAQTAMEYGPGIYQKVVDYLRANDEYYAELADKVDATLDAYDSERTPDSRVLVAYADLHGNVPMIDIIRNVAHRVQADLIVSAGDDTSTGASIEGQLYAAAWQDETIPRARVDGNHDSADVRGQLSGAGFVTLEGHTVDVGEFKIVGDGYPGVVGMFASSPALPTTERPADTANRVIKTACEEGAEIAIVHDFSDTLAPDVDPAACRLITLGGHMHQNIAPRFTLAADGSVQSIDLHSMGSGTGATANTLRFGPLQGVAYLYVVELGPANQMATVHVISILPNQEISIAGYSEGTAKVDTSTPEPTRPEHLMVPQ